MILSSALLLMTVSALDSSFAVTGGDVQKQQQSSSVVVATLRYEAYILDSRRVLKSSDFQIKPNTHLALVSLYPPRTALFKEDLARANALRVGGSEVAIQDAVTDNLRLSARGAVLAANLDFKKGPDHTWKVNFEPRPGGGAEKTKVIMSFSPNEAKAIVMPRATKTGGLEVWIFEPGKASLSSLPAPPIVDVPQPQAIAESRQVIFKVQEYSVPGPYQDARKPYIGPAGNALYEEKNLSGSDLELFRSELKELGAKLVSSPMMRSMEDSPATVSIAGNGNEDKISLTLTHEKRLRLDVSLKAKTASASYHFHSNGRLATGKSRVIIGRPNADTGTQPVWIVTATVLDDQGNPISSF